MPGDVVDVVRPPSTVVVVFGTIKDVAVVSGGSVGDVKGVDVEAAVATGDVVVEATVAIDGCVGNKVAGVVVAAVAIVGVVEARVTIVGNVGNMVGSVGNVNAVVVEAAAKTRIMQ